MDDRSDVAPDNVIQFPGVSPEEQFANEEDSHRNTEIFLRISFANHLRLHAMADNKSRMLISVNGIVLSGLAAYCSTAVDLRIPIGTIATLLVTSALSMLAALLAAFPPRMRAGSLNPASAPDSIARSALGGSHGDNAVSMSCVLSATHDDASLQLGLLDSLQRLGGMLEMKHRRLRAAYMILGAGVVAAVGVLAVALACVS